MHSTSTEGLSGRSVDELERFAAQPETDRLDVQTWEMMRELAVARMSDDRLAVDIRLRWVRLALTAIRKKAQGSDVDRKAALAEETNVRVNAIRAFGAAQDGGLLDPVDLCESVFREIGQTPEEVRTKAVLWRSLPPQEMLRLRRVKNLLTPLRGVESLIPPGDPLHRELSAWLSVIPDLP
ncbi:hypothetical protein [Streptomyces glaucescens]|uniref:Uncharacterized protein n=1 Tax=Streptomyces glaucescens TaxID=1907 RepID=A0A089XAF6_STRGA|nr:hypothetical protein [Streptomyces glaucescens]AIR98139.1 hypothetical protein SGLAU_10670 [Streptomyces glaucescens]